MIPTHLNKYQQEAIKTIEGPLLILAGAGTGKTSVITHRIAYIVNLGFSPKSILGVTFTNKASIEMKERLTKLLSPAASEKVTISTFHSLAGKILRKHIHLLGFGNDFSIADMTDQLGLLSQITTELEMTRFKIDRDYIKNKISNFKNALMTSYDMREMDEILFNTQVADIWDKYQERLKEQNMIDFDDMLSILLELWNKFPHTLEEYQTRYRYIMVDEYQDTNKIQFTIVSKLAITHKNICVVGDDDQSIYGWRGADVSNILNFQDHFSNAKIVKLEENYRSTSNILNSANAIIANNTERYPKKLWSSKGKGELIKLIKLKNPEEESRFICEAIQEEKRNNSSKYQDFAILYRSNHQARIIEKELRAKSIPYTIIGSKSFFERKEIRDTIAYIKIINNSRDSASFLRILNVPARKIGSSTIQKLKYKKDISKKSFENIISYEHTDLPAQAKKSLVQFVEIVKKYRQKIFAAHQDFAVILKNYLIEIAYLNNLAKIYKPRSDAENRYINVCEFINDISEYERYTSASGKDFLQKYLEQFTLKDDSDKLKKHDKNATEKGVTLLTVHSSKGLEFNKVFIVGMENKLFPHENAVKANQTNEERRLFYVAVTRAKNQLLITYTTQRKKFGKTFTCRPSMFVKELPDELKIYLKPEDVIKPASQEEIAKIIAEMKRQLAE